MAALLTVNAGSSSLKLGLFEDTEPPAPILVGTVDHIDGTPTFRAHGPGGAEIGRRDWPQGADRDTVFADLVPWFERQGGAGLAGAGHRVVHGGRRLTAPVRVDPAVLDELESLVPLAPLHQPHSLHAIRALTALRPGLPQAACFDTAFHRTMPGVARRYAIPRDLFDDGIERYGFHGLSYEFIAGRLRTLEPRLAAGRIVVAHLGSGASLCALQDGVSVGTTMGFTALDGVPMGTRCGAIDPGVLLYLQQARGLSVAAVEDLLYHRSGLLGVSGISADMRELGASADPHAQEAVALFCYRVAQEIAALGVALGGLDAVVFTAGIGEHDAAVRTAVCARLGWLGVALDDAANQAHARRIDASAGRIAVLVLPTDEEAVIAGHTRSVLSQPMGGGQTSFRPR